MGQYFILVNLDKREYIIPDLMKLWEIMNANRFPLGNVILYLTATPNTDGTFLFNIEGELKYFGRWCGDRIVLMGDYGGDVDGWNFVNIRYEFKDITKEVKNEWKRVAGLM